MHIPTPPELGLPEKFEKWRDNQAEALLWLSTRQKRIKALAAPTGFGKTSLYMAYALMTGAPTCFVTDSRALQSQLMAEFESIGLVDIRGRSNYPCDLREEYTCEDGYTARCPYKGTINCPASQAEMRAATSRLVVTNYAKWTHARKYGTGMSHFQQVVFDEGHETPNALARAMAMVISHNERERHIGVNPPDDREDMLGWKRWAIESRRVVEGLLAKAQERIRSVSEPSAAHVRHALHMKHLHRRLGTLMTANPNNWVVEEYDKGFAFDAIRPGRYAEGALLLHVPSILIVSATLRPKTLFMIGQGKDTFDFREFDSEFDPKRNPIYHIPTMRVDARAADLGMLWIRLDQIAAKRQDRNGIVHTISYSRRDEILKRSRFGPRMLVNEKGDAPTEMVELFKESEPGTILVSPSVGQGFDFPGPQCEWQFLCKIPFPPPSKILKARTEDDKEYPYYLAMQKMVQIFGRGMRFHEDRCENFIGDDHIQWFLPRYGHLAPKSFHSFYRQVSVLPQPPAALERS